MSNENNEYHLAAIESDRGGFVPKGLERIYPDEALRELGWGGFDEKVQI